MSGHTPGPWFITGTQTKYIEARIPGGLIQEVAAVGPTAADNGYGPQQNGNANLIAAAPDLLELAEYMKSLMDEDSIEDMPYGLILRAIAKAKGDQA